MRLTGYFLGASLALLIAAPLAAQDNRVITLSDTTVVTIFDNDSTFIFITFPEPTDAEVARQEAAQRAMDAVAEYFENCGCLEGGGVGTTVVRYGVPSVAVLLGLLGIRKLGQLVDAIENHEHSKPEEPEEPYGEGHG